MNYSKKTKQILILILFITGTFLILLPINPFYIGLDSNAVFPSVKGNVFSTDYLMFGFLAPYALLVLESILALIITVWYYKRQEVEFSEATDTDALEPVFSYMLTDMNPRKTTILLVFLSLASFYEELIYRFFVLNVCAAIGVPVIVSIIISGFIFALAHRGNGYMAYVFSTFFSGMIFSVVFIYWGILGSWFLHLAWNALVTLEEKINIWARSISIKTISGRCLRRNTST